MSKELFRTRSAGVDKTGELDINASEKNSSAEVGGAKRFWIKLAKARPPQSRAGTSALPRDKEVPLSQSSPGFSLLPSGLFKPLIWPPSLELDSRGSALIGGHKPAVTGKGCY